MCRLAKKYPEYGFEVHKGYGTKGHVIQLKLLGPCASHRISFLK
jgi:ribonuclease HII